MFHFAGATDAGDWATTQKLAVSSGCLAAISVPDLYEDPTQRARLAEDQILWAPALNTKEFAAAVNEAQGGCGQTHSDSPALTQFVEILAKGDHKVSQVSPMTEGQLPAAAELGYSLVIDRDRWLLMRFPSASDAADECGRRRHCIHAGRFVLWSDPPGMYRRMQTFTLPDDEVSWSALLDDPGFVSLVLQAATG